MGRRAKKLFTTFYKCSCTVAILLLLVLFMNFTSLDVLAEESEITLNVSNGDDISTVLQQAVKNYSYVIIPEGEYYCSNVKLNNIDGIVIYAEGVKITQSGDTNPIIYTSNGSTASDITIAGGTWDAAGKDIPAFRFYGNVSNITLSNLTVENSANAGIRFKESSNVTLDKVTSTDNAGYAVLFEAVENAELSNCSFNNSKNGINFNNCLGDLIVTFTKCTGNVYSGIVATACPKITINDSELNKNGEGLRISGATDRVSLSRNNMKNNNGFGIRIFDCTGDVAYSKNYAYDNAKTGISMENCTGIVSLYRVNAKRNADCGFTIVNCTNIKINQCVSSNNANYGYNLDGNKADSGYKYCVNMKYSKASTNGTIGIRVINCEQTNIQETTSEKNTAAGVYSIDCEAVTLNQLISQNNKSNGASINNTVKVKAANCTFDGNQANGLRINGCQNIWVTNGEFFNNVDTGITFGNVDKLSVKGPVVHDNGGYGINIDVLTTSGLVKDVECYNNGNIGLRYKDTTGKINTQYSKVYNNGSSGIYGVNCANMVVNGTEVYGNAVFGVNATDSPLANVKYCNIHNNKDIGIRYSGCEKIIVTDCDSNNNVNAGIYSVDCKTITFNLARVKGNEGFGINANNGTAMSIVSCTSESNREAGFRANECKRVKIVDCVTTDNTGAGIYAGAISGYITISNVQAQANGGYGININSIKGTSTIEKVSSVKNADSGYMINLCDEVVVNESTSTSNGAHGVYILESKAELNDVEVKESYWCGLSASGKKAIVDVNRGKYTNNGTRPDRFENDDNLCAGIGVYAGATVKANEVIGCNNHGCGMAVAGAEDGTAISKLEAYGCTLNENGDHGIGARPYGKVNVSTSESGLETKVINNKHTGIILNDHCTSDYIKGCTISGNGKAGMSVSVNATAALIEGNIITDNTEDGIHVSESSSANIKNCEVKNNKLAGIGVYSSSKVSVQECVVSANESYGICIDTSIASAIDNCSIKDNIKAGIVVRNSGEIKEVNKSDICNNNTYGIYCSEGGKVTANDVIVTGNWNDGVRITGDKSQAIINNITASENQANGVIVTEGGSLNELKGATIENNGKHGLAVYANSTLNVDAEELNCAGNGQNQIYVQEGAITDLTTKK